MDIASFAGRLGELHVVPVVPRNSTIELAPYDPAWPNLYDGQAGKITKEEKQGKKGKTFVCYILTDSAGNKVMLSGAGNHGWRHDETASAQSAPVNLEEYVNKDVTIVGKGRQIEREGQTITRLVEITKIDVATPTPAAQ